jgi:flagella basal body P-ring formation protein FlgA
MRNLILLLAIVPGIPHGALAAPEARIELLPQVQVGTGTVALGQVTRLHANDLALMRALADLSIGRAPPAGETVRLERKALELWVQKRVHVLQRHIVWDGPDQSRITASTRRISGEEIAAVAGSAIRDWLEAQSDRHEIRIQRMPRDLDVPEGALRLQPRSLAGSQLRKRMVVWVDVWAADRFVRTVPVAFGVTAWAEAEAASARIDAGAPLAAGSVRRHEVDLAAHSGARAIDPPMEGGRRARHTVREGEVLRPSDTERSPEVVRGQWAALRAQAGAVLLESRVEVLQDGRTGDKVRVRQPGATAAMVARVMGPGQLEVMR